MRYYRLGYNLLATLLILPLLLYGLLHPGVPLWAWEGALGWLANGLLLAALVGYLFTLDGFDSGEFLGLKQVHRAEREVDERAPLNLTGVYRFVRHPWYALGLVVIWSRDMDSHRLAVAIIISFYLVIGSWFEERRLLSRYGEAYRRYLGRVPGLYPWPGRHLSRQEAQRLTDLAD